MGEILNKGYKSSIRNAFAHSLYTVDKEKRTISLRPTTSPHETLSFEEFQKCFLYSTILMNRLHNSLEANHMEAAKKNAALTSAFMTPDGIKVQVLAETFEMRGEEYPRFRIVKVID